MKRISLCLLLGAGLATVSGDASGRGGFGGGGFRGGSFSGSYGRTAGGGYGSGFSSFSGANRYGGSYSGSRATESSSGWGGRSASGSYDHSWTSASGASVNTSGSRSAAEGRYGGVAASGNRDTTVTTAGGQTYSASREGGFASGPGGRTVGGASGSWDGKNSSGNWNAGAAGNRYTGNFAGGTSGSFENRAGSGSWESAFSGNRYTGNMNHYASVYGANGAHSTAYWSTGYMGARAGYVRTGFGYYNCFTPTWYTAHPGCWAAAGWAAGAAWAAPTYAAVAGYTGMPADPPPDYDYGSSIVYQGDQVYVNGQPGGTAQQYADQATAIAGQGQTAAPPPTDDWKPLGVFALVQGDEKTSNYIFQLAVNKDGVIRGNYYDGVQDTTTEVLGSIDKKTRLAAWTVGKKKDRVFEAGVYNLTQPECPCLLHLGGQQTTQMLLVRVEQPKGGGPPVGS